MQRPEVNTTAAASQQMYINFFCLNLELVVTKLLPSPFSHSSRFRDVSSLSPFQLRPQHPMTVFSLSRSTRGESGNESFDDLVLDRGILVVAQGVRVTDLECQLEVW